MQKCYICKRNILKKFAKDKNYWKVRDHSHYTVKYSSTAHNLKFNVSNEISVVFHRDSNMIIIKELKNQQMSLKDNLNVLEKTKKSTKLFPFK